MEQYRPYPILLEAKTQTVSASTTATVSNPFVITSAGATRGLRVDILVDVATAAAGITAKLQHAVTETATNYADVDAVQSRVSITTVASPTWFSILLSAADPDDGPVLPLRPHGRVVVTTGVGDSVTISDIRVTQEA
jgi:hypothetical protein